MARCTDCDKFLTEVDREAMMAVNAEHVLWTGQQTYDLDGEDTADDLHCADCIDARSARAQERRDEDFYGGDSPTLAETAAWAQRFK